MYLEQYEFAFQAVDTDWRSYTMIGYLLPEGAVVIPRGAFEIENHKRKRVTDAWFERLGVVAGLNNPAGERDRCVGYFSTGKQEHFYEHEIRESLETCKQVFGEIPASMAARLKGGDNA